MKPLKTRRQDESPQLIRMEVSLKPAAESCHPLHNDEVCAELFKLLSELPIARYGSESANTEPRLCAQVIEFFRIIQHYS